RCDDVFGVHVVGRAHVDGVDVRALAHLIDALIRFAAELALEFVQRRAARIGRRLELQMWAALELGHDLCAGDAQPGDAEAQGRHWRSSLAISAAFWRSGKNSSD